MKNPSVQQKRLQQKEGRLICPACGESLCRHDVESFACCPYCSHAFVLSGEMEDFLLQPVVEHWCQINMQQFQKTEEFEPRSSQWL
jgi:Zn-finger nucleic acid-binding protein